MTKFDVCQRPACTARYIYLACSYTPRSTHGAMPRLRLPPRPPMGPSFCQVLMLGRTRIHGFVRRSGLVCPREASFGPQHGCGCAQDGHLLLRYANPPLQTCVGANRSLPCSPQGLARFSATALECIVVFSVSLTRDRARHFAACVLTRARSSRVLACRLCAGCARWFRPCVLRLFSSCVFSRAHELGG